MIKVKPLPDPRLLPDDLGKDIQEMQKVTTRPQAVLIYGKEKQKLMLPCGCMAEYTDNSDLEYHCSHGTEVTITKNPKGQREVMIAGDGFFSVNPL